MNHFKLICLPVEFASREFEAKSVLAYELIKYGWSIVIGQQWEIFNQLSQFPPCFVIFKGQNKLHQTSMAYAKKYGHFIISIEEEALGMTEEHTLSKSSTKELYTLADVIFSQGEFETQFHRKMSSQLIDIKTFGNIRVDLLKKEYRFLFEDKIDFIRKTYGRFILINTNFALLNSYMGDFDHILNEHIRSGYTKEDNNSIQEFYDYYNWTKKCYLEIVKLLEYLVNKWPEINFIIRPHPGEDFEKAKLSYPKSDNLKIIKEGSHIPWTFASELLIHTSCTTGLEAEIGGGNSISIVPQEMWYTKQFLSNKVNQTFNSSELAINYIESVLSGEFSKIKNKLNDYKFFIENIDSESAVKNIVNYMNNSKHSSSAVQFNIKPSLPRHDFQIKKCSINYNECKQLFNKLYMKEKNLEIKGEPQIFTMADSLFFIK